VEPQVVKWYTRSRKFPQLIGRTHDGTRIPGGPYTPTQFIAAAIIAVIAVNTVHLWARFGLVTNVALLAGVGYGTVWVLGRVPLASRNPVSIGLGAARALSRPRMGTLRGRPVRARRPRKVRHRIVLAPVPSDIAHAARIAAKRAATPPRLPPRRALGHPRARPSSGVEQAIAAAASKNAKRRT
jgi:hypothetical protein